MPDASQGSWVELVVACETLGYALPTAPGT